MPLRPLIPRLLLATLLGAATTIAVAWSFAIHGMRFRWPPESPTCELAPGGKEAWLFYPTEIGRGWSVLRTERRPVTEVGQGWLVITRFSMLEGHGYQRIASLPNDRHLPEVPEIYRHEFQFDWPWRAMWSLVDQTDTSGQPLWTPEKVLTIRASVPPNPMPFTDLGTFALTPGLSAPLGVIPIGFLLDALLFAALWWTLLLIPRALRARSRRRRNLCPHCTYDLRATPPPLPCPECGTPRPIQIPKPQAPNGTEATP